MYKLIDYRVKFRETMSDTCDLMESWENQPDVEFQGESALKDYLRAFKQKEKRLIYRLKEEKRIIEKKLIKDPNNTQTIEDKNTFNSTVEAYCNRTGENVERIVGYIK
jgi:hypothetical protein